MTLLALILLIHAGRSLLIEPFGPTDLVILREFAFVPARLADWLGMVEIEAIQQELARRNDPGSAVRLQLSAILLDGAAKPWSLLTYALLHAGWEHAIINALWMLAFGAPVFRRFGEGRALLFLAVTTVAAAVFHALLNTAEVLPVIGASGGVSALTAAAMRFVLAGDGPLDLSGAHDRPAPPLAQALREPRVLVFLGVWFGINLLGGLGLPLAADTGQTIAWEAHVGGFLAGLLLFPLFDRHSGR
jgi:membrane associated rhomboid family serine protease